MIDGLLTRAVSLPVEKLLKMIILMLVMSLITAFFSGYILGLTSAEKDCYTYLAFWKVTTDCDKCQNYDVRAICAIREKWDEIPVLAPKNNSDARLYQ